MVDPADWLALVALGPSGCAFRPPVALLRSRIRTLRIKSPLCCCTPRVRGKMVAARGVAPPLRTLKEWFPELLEDAARKETAARLAVPLNALNKDAPGAETRGNDAPA